MIFSQSKNNLSPPEFISGLVAIYSREWGGKLPSSLARIKASLILILGCVLSISLCDYYLVAIFFAGIVSCIYILFTFHKSKHNFADQLAHQAKKEILRCGFLILILCPVALADFFSPTLTVPTSPPRCTPS